MKLLAVTVARRARAWSLRYAPAEIAGTLTALVGAFVVREATHSAVAAAAAGSACETIGFYSVAVARELVEYYRRHRGQAKLRRLWLTGAHTLRGMLIEFGPAELLDSFLVRPFCFYVFPKLLGNFLGGLLVGKVLADIVFFVLAAVGYELRKKAALTPKDVHNKHKGS